MADIIAGGGSYGPAVRFKKVKVSKKNRKVILKAVKNARKWNRRFVRDCREMGEL